ncbi:MAG TPA: DNA-processing protein DprA [Aeromicrobium sp.]|nr:DNA-processing protein DprA [Aeromicrobium sp.]
MKDVSDRRARLLLSLTIEPGDPRLAELLDTSDPKELWQAISGGRIANSQAWTLAAETASARADRALADAKLVDARWVVPRDNDWPTGLDDLAHCESVGQVAGSPLGIWVRGGADLLDLMAAPIGVVGARSNTTYGAECASDIAADCADQGHTIISGAAFGIDACAHRGALVAGGATVAVMACGVDLDYPRAHAALLRRTAEEGLIISEYAPGIQPARHRFLVRNRLIAAMSVGLVVVEAAGRSGSLNTLNWADRLGRTTMAVPGPVTSQASTGVHRAIRDGKALLVTSGKEVLADTFGWLDSSEVDLAPGPRRVLQRLNQTPLSESQLAAGLRWGTVAVGRSLRLLESHGLAETENGLWVSHTPMASSTAG